MVTTAGERIELAPVEACFKGWCRECRGPIRLKQLIVRSKSGRWEHWRCAP